MFGTYIADFRTESGNIAKFARFYLMGLICLLSYQKAVNKALNRAFIKALSFYISALLSALLNAF